MPPLLSFLSPSFPTPSFSLPFPPLSFSYFFFPFPPFLKGDYQETVALRSSVWGGMSLILLFPPQSFPARAKLGECHVLSSPSWHKWILWPVFSSLLCSLCHLLKSDSCTCLLLFCSLQTSTIAVFYRCHWCSSALHSSCLSHNPATQGTACPALQHSRKGSGSGCRFM